MGPKMPPKLFSFTQFAKNAPANPLDSHTFKTKDLKPFRFTHFQKKVGAGSGSQVPGKKNASRAGAPGYRYLAQEQAPSKMMAVINSNLKPLTSTLQKDR